MSRRLLDLASFVVGATLAAAIVCRPMFRRLREATQ